MSILIAVPTYETISPECFRAIYAVKGDDITFDYVKGYDCAKARNTIAREALEGNYEYVLMVDSDIVLPPETLSYMLEYPVDICFGIYPRKTNPEETELFYRGTFSFDRRYTYTEIEELSDTRINVKGSGFGCALIKTDVFRRLLYPWFKFVSYDNGDFLSEDLYFCMMAEGLTMQADLRVKCGHIMKSVQY